MARVSTYGDLQVTRSFEESSLYLICSTERAGEGLNYIAASGSAPALKRSSDHAETVPSSILIVEDNPGDVFVIQEALREHDIRCNVTVIPDGEKAMRFFDKLEQDDSATCPDLLLLDINLPRFSGHDILARIRKGTRCATLPIVVVSSSDVPADLEKNRELGANASFRKSNSLEAFLRLGALVKSFLPA